MREGDIARGVPVTPKTGRVRIDELIEDLVTEYQTNKRRSIDVLKIRCKKHILPFFGGRRASTVASSDINRFIISRQNAGASNAEINRELSALKRAFSLAIEAGTLITKPHIPMLEEDNVRTGFFEREQFEALRRYLPDHVKPVANFAYITGWRIKSEILMLQWRQIDFEAGTIMLDPGTTKNKEGRVFPLTHELRALMEEQRAKTDALQRERSILCPWVFHKEGVPFKSFRKSWASACRMAGLPGRIPHDFRRTAVRNLVRVGVPERVAMQLTGHKTRSVFERYNIVSQGDLLEAAKRLNAAAGIVSGIAAESANNTSV
jgi:integrase